jgi:hypothetical protein
LQKNSDLEKVSRLTKEIGNLLSKNELLLFNHFSTLKSLLSDDQLLKFTNIIDNMGKNIPKHMEGDRQGPPRLPPGVFPHP